MSITATAASTSPMKFVGKIVGWVLVLIVVTWVMSDFIIPYFMPPEEAGIRMVTKNMDNIVVKHSGQVESETFAKPERYEDNGRINLRSVSVVSSEAAGQIAQAREVRLEAIAEAKGEFLKPKGVWLPASQKAWMPTGIPVYSCMLITVEGRMRYGTYEAGPAGVDLDDLSPRNRASWDRWKRDRKTLLADVPFGTVLGKVCQDSEAKDCGPAFPIGDAIYVSPDDVRAGHLWTIVNGFPEGRTDAILDGIEQLNMSDYTAYEGGFRIEKDKAAIDRCAQ